MKSKLISLSILLLSFFANTVTAQIDSIKRDKIVIVETLDGNRFSGKVVERTDSKITIETQTTGTLTLDINKLKSIVEGDAARLKKDGYWFENPHASRNFFAPTGFGLRKGEGYYQNILVGLNQFSYGISDNFSIGGGFEIFSILAGRSPAVLFLTPKASFNAGKNYNVGVGALIGSFGWNKDRVGAGLLYLTNTFGTRDKNFTAAIGYGYADGSLAKKPTFNIGAQIRGGKKWSFMTENYFIDNFLLFSAGARRLSEDSAWDFGLVYPIADGEGAPFFIPFVGYTVFFGKKKGI